jgi:hypothetical protein
VLYQQEETNRVPIQLIFNVQNPYPRHRKHVKGKERANCMGYIYHELEGKSWLQEPETQLSLCSLRVSFWGGQSAKAQGTEIPDETERV